MMSLMAYATLIAAYQAVVFVTIARTSTSTRAAPAAFRTLAAAEQDRFAGDQRLGADTDGEAPATLRSRWRRVSPI
jgi:hypothetical protein